MTSTLISTPLDVELNTAVLKISSHFVPTFRTADDAPSTYKALKEYFRYTPEGDLVKRKAWSRKCRVGKPMGTYDGKYIRATFKKKNYLLHRLVWIWHYGDINSGYQVDHINHNPKDNKIENLRLATHQENNRNKGLHSKNSTGHSNISYFGKTNIGCVSLMMVRITT